MNRLRILMYTIFKSAFLFLTISIFFSSTVHGYEERQNLENDSSSTIFTQGEDDTDEEDYSDDKNYYVITGYYSPIMGQDEYITGTYEGDIALNGGGLFGASGREVFPGMLAAPKTYPFGTKIYLEGYGVGSVEDRGGAIVNAGNRGYGYDRIDIWMGTGDEGRKRAINWGKRTVAGYIVGEDNVLSLSLKSPIEDMFLDLQVGPESSSDDVKKLQIFFEEIGLYKGLINGNYSSVQDIVLKYQYDKGLISSEDDWGAGYFGAKTASLLKEDLGVAIRKETYLTKIERDKIEKLKNNIINIIKKRNYNSVREKVAIKKLKSQVTTIISKSKNKKLQIKLQYFNSIM